MKKLTKRLLSLMLVLMLSVCGVLGYSSSSKAADVPTITITPIATDSFNKQAFNVYVSVGGAQYSSNAGSGTLAAGNNSLVFNTSETVSLQVFAPYTNDNGGTSWITKYLDSINTYYVSVSLKGSDGASLATQTITLSKYNAPEVVYNAPASIDAGDSVYVTSNPSVVFKYGEGSKTITYNKVAKEDKSYTVNYVDESDNVIFTEAAVLKYGDQVALTAPETYTVDDNTYRLKTTETFDVSFENAQSVYTFEYVKQIPAPETPYEITINLNDEEGALLYSFKKGIDVGGKVNIALPKTYEINFKKYVLDANEAPSIEREFASTDATVYNVKYILSDENTPYDITVNYVDYESGAVLSGMNAQVTPDGEPFVYDISSLNTIKIDDTEYQVMSGQGNDAGQIVHRYGDSTKTYNVYYSKQKIDNPDAYPVTLRYICINDNEVLSTVTKEVAFNSTVTFDVAPETMTIEDKEYIRLNGQDQAIVHAYSSSQSAYTVFYRDASVPIEHEPVVVIQTITQYITQDDGTVDSNEDGTTVPESVEITTVVDEEGNELNYDEDGNEVQIEDGQIVVVEDEEVPLANMFTDGIFGNSSNTVTLLMVGGIAAIAVILLMVLAKKKKSNE